MNEVRHGKVTSCTTESTHVDVLATLRMDVSNLACSTSTDGVLTSNICPSVFACGQRGWQIVGTLGLTERRRNGVARRLVDFHGNRQTGRGEAAEKKGIQKYQPHRVQLCVNAVATLQASLAAVDARCPAII